MNISNCLICFVRKRLSLAVSLSLSLSKVERHKKKIGLFSASAINHSRVFKCGFLINRHTFIQCDFSAIVKNGKVVISLKAIIRCFNSQHTPNEMEHENIIYTHWLNICVRETVFPVGLQYATNLPTRKSRMRWAGQQQISAWPMNPHKMPNWSSLRIISNWMVKLEWKSILHKN